MGGNYDFTVSETFFNLNVELNLNPISGGIVPVPINLVMCSIRELSRPSGLFVNDSNIWTAVMKIIIFLIILLIVKNSIR